MIFVKAWEDNDGCVWLESQGHASSSQDDAEGVRVCAAVSALMVVLWALTEQDGEWRGSGSGYARIRVLPEYAAWATFVLSGVSIINHNHPGFINVDFGEELGGEETWNRPLSPLSN